MEPTGTIPTTPDKRIMEALISDLSYEDAVCELIDNSIDSAIRNNEQDEVRIDVIYNAETSEGGTDELIIRDDGGGVPEEDLEVLVRLATSSDQNLDSAIGVYGVGLKRACFKLGSKARIETRHLSDDQTHGILIPEDWLQSEGEWSDLTKLAGDSLEAGTTEIRIQGVQFEFDADRLREIIQQTYEYYLKGTEEGFLANIYINDNPVDPPEPVDWSYNPFGFHPRRYPEVPIQADEFGLSDDIYVTITVGLLREGGNNSGTDIFCQGRKVLHADRGPEGGYTSGDLNNWSGSMNRFKLILEFWTDGDNKDLPWNSSKSDIEYSRVLQKAYDWAYRISEAHRKIKYDIPEAFVKPYDPSHEDAYRSGDIQVMDSYRNRQRDSIRRGEKADFPSLKRDVDNLKSKAERHAKLHIICPNDVSNNSHIDGYKRQVWYEFSDEYQLAPEELVEVDSVPESVNQQTYESEMNRLERRAREDAAEGIFDDIHLEQWEQPYYRYCLSQEVESLDSLTKLSENDNDFVEDGDNDMDNRTSSNTEDTISPERQTQPLQSRTTANRPSDLDSDLLNQETTNNLSEEENRSATDDTGEREAGILNETNTSSDRSVMSEAEDTNISTSSERTIDQTLSQESEIYEDEVPEIDIPSAPGRSVSLQVEIPSQLWPALCDSVELPESADKDEVEERLSDDLADLIRLCIYED